QVDRKYGPVGVMDSALSSRSVQFTAHFHQAGERNLSIRVAVLERMQHRFAPRVRIERKHGPATVAWTCSGSALARRTIKPAFDSDQSGLRPIPVCPVLLEGMQDRLGARGWIDGKKRAQAIRPAVERRPVENAIQLAKSGGGREAVGRADPKRID